MNLTVENRRAKPQMPSSLSDPELAEIGRYVHAYRAARVLFLASRLDVFTFLKDRPRSLKEICAALKIKARPAEMFLNALVALGFLVKSGQSYSNTPRSARFLVRGSPEDFGPILKFQDILWPAWGDLERVLRNGSPRRNLGHWMRKSRDFIAEYIHGMRRIAQRPAQEVAELVGRPGDRALLDVGGGPGVYSLAFVDRNPDLRAVIIDLPPTLRMTETFLKGNPSRGRIRLEPGNYYRLRLAPRSFDVILLSHVTHNEGPSFNRRLFSQCRKALRPGGRLAVHDFMTEADGASPRFSALFAVHMMSFTEEGAVYRAEQYKTWMREAGLEGIRQTRIAGESETPSVLLVGAKG